MRRELWQTVAFCKVVERGIQYFPISKKAVKLWGKSGKIGILFNRLLFNIRDFRQILYQSWSKRFF